MAGSSLAHIAHLLDVESVSHHRHTFKQNYGGVAKRSLKTFGSKSPSATHRSTREKLQNFLQQRFRPIWMHGIKGCFLCKEDFLVRRRHGKEDKSRVIERLKAEHPTALVTVENLSAIYHLNSLYAIVSED